jgi:hypothetical protein
MLVTARLGALAVATAVALLPAARAEEPPASPPPRQEEPRTVNGHLFQPSLVVRGPFTTTHFALGMLFGSGSATGPVYDLQGAVVGTRDYTFVALGQALSFEWAFLQGLSARLDVVTSLYSGIDRPSVLVVGATVRAGAGGGLAWSMPLGDSWRIGAALDLSYAPQFDILVAAALRKAIDEGSIDAASALKIENVLTTAPGVSAAWAPVPALGFVATLAYAYSTVDYSGATLTRESIDAGLAAELDFRAFTGVPVSLTAAGRVSSPVDGSSNTIVDGVVGVFYTGSPNVALGLELGVRSFRIRPELPEALESTTGVAQIGLRHYW